MVHKNHGDSFEGTDLEDVLATAGVGRQSAPGRMAAVTTADELAFAG